MLMTATNPTAHTAPTAVEVDIELFTFVERYATSLFRWDVLLHFGAGPDAGYTATEIAKRLNRSTSATIKELDDLTYLRVLTRRYTPERTTYRLSRRPYIRRAVTRLANLSQQGAVMIPSV